jgi:hypothetical protein
MSNLSSSRRAAAALIEPPMSSAPSASDTADVLACHANALLLRVRFITISFSMSGNTETALQEHAISCEVLRFRRQLRDGYGTWTRH